MKLSYSGFKDEDVFILTDFTCEPAQDLLKKKNLFKILWSKDLPISLTMDDYQMLLKPNEVVFCTPLNVMEIPMETEGLISFVFNKEFFCIQTHDDQVSCDGFLFFGSSQPQTISLSQKESSSLDALTQIIKEDLLIKDHLQGEMLRSLLKRLLIQSTRMLRNEMPDPGISNAHMNIIREYNILVEKYFRKYHQVKDYADLLFKSPKTLANLFPNYSDKTPLMVINDRIMLEAKRLLMYSDKSNNEIADELGYHETGHFSKFFKKHEGLSPSNFKKKKMKQF